MNTNIFNSKLTIIGSGTCSPNSKRNAPANHLVIGNKRFLIDGGSGSLHALALAGIDYSLLDGIFYTHFHPDHIGDLVPMLQALIWDPTTHRTKDFFIYGPRGIQKIFDRLRSIFPESMTPHNFGIIIHEMEHGNEISFTSASVKAFHVQHTETSLGYRFTTSQGYVIAFSGDTGYGQTVIDLTQDADIAVLECSWPEEEYETRTFKGHLTATLAGSIAQQANIKKLILSHIYPDTDALPLKDRCASEFSGEIIIANDFDAFDLF